MLNLLSPLKWIVAMKPLSEKRNVEAVIKNKPISPHTPNNKKSHKPSARPKGGRNDFSLLISILMCIFTFPFNKYNFPFNKRTLWWPTPKSLLGLGIGWWLDVTSPKAFWGRPACHLRELYCGAEMAVDATRSPHGSVFGTLESCF